MDNPVDHFFAYLFVGAIALGPALLYFYGFLYFFPWLRASEWLVFGTLVLSSVLATITAMVLTIGGMLAAAFIKFRRK